jgi:hypothetical protein
VLKGFNASSISSFPELSWRKDIVAFFGQKLTMSQVSMSVDLLGWWDRRLAGPDRRDAGPTLQLDRGRPLDHRFPFPPRRHSLSDSSDFGTYVMNNRGRI